MIARSYWHTFELPVAVTRFANLYGGGDLNLSRLVPECALAAIEGRAPVIRSDGTLERDYLYVEDAVEAYLAIWELLEDGRGAGEAFNAGGDRPHSVLEVAELVCRVAGTGVEPDVRGTGTPPGEITRQWVDSTKLRSMSGWEPRASLEEGLARTVDWYRDYLPELRRSARAVSTGPGHAASLSRQMRDRLTVTPAQYRLVAYVTLGALTVIVLTGAAVRLTDSGLGCSNWPKCGGSPLPPLSTHALIEFGNRAISGVVGLLTIVAAVLAFTRKPFRRDLAWLASACRCSCSRRRCSAGSRCASTSRPGS